MNVQNFRYIPKFGKVIELPNFLNYRNLVKITGVPN